MAAAADVETDETVEQAPSVSNDLEDATEVSIEALSKDFATLFCVETSRKVRSLSTGWVVRSRDCWLTWCRLAVWRLPQTTSWRDWMNITSL